jgi:hypothetical protein
VSLNLSSFNKDRHGNRRIFARRFGRKIRLRRPEGSEEFFEEYRQALDALAQPAPLSAPIRANEGTFGGSSVRVKKLIPDNVTDVSHHFSGFARALLRRSLWFPHCPLSGRTGPRDAP